MRTGSRFASLVLMGLLPLLLACGGGGGDGGEEPAPSGPEATFQGEYIRLSLTLTTLPSDPPGASDHRCCRWGLTQANGAGSMSTEFDQNVEGEIERILYDVGVPYTVGGDRAFRIGSASSPGVPIFEGGVAADGRFACAASVVADGHPTVHLFARRGGSYGDASLNGAYIPAGLLFRASETQAYFGAATFGGDGHGSMTLQWNQMGGLGGPETGMIDYTVLSNGNTMFDMGLRRGGGLVVASADVVVLGGSETVGLDPDIQTFIRATTGRTLAEFTGTYFLAGYYEAVGPDEPVAVTGTLTSDGVGGYTTLLNYTDGATVLTNVAGGGSYGFMSDGSLEFKNSLERVYSGGLTPDGAFASLSGTRDSGGDPTIFFLVR